MHGLNDRSQIVVIGGWFPRRAVTSSASPGPLVQFREAFWVITAANQSNRRTTSAELSGLVLAGSDSAASDITRRETAPASWFRTMRPFHCAAPLLVAALAIAAAASVVAQRRPSAVKGTTVLVRLLPQTPEQGYVGEERCSFCHSSELTQFHKTSHAKVVSESKQPMNCESCHGPGKPHADAEEAASGDDALMAAAKQLIFAFHGTVQENTSRCLSCHITSRSQLAYSHS